MRLYGRQSRVRARRRRGPATLGVVVGWSRSRSAHSSCSAATSWTACSVAGVQLGGESRAEAERRSLAAVGDPLQRASRSPSAGALGDARRPSTSASGSTPRAPRARRSQSGRCAALLFSIGFHREIEPVLRYPSNFALPVELAGRTQTPVDARLVLSRTASRSSIPAKPGVGFDRRGDPRAIGHAALAGRGRCRCAPSPTDAAISTAAAPAGQAQRVARMLSAPIVISAARPAAGRLAHPRGSRRCSRRRRTGTDRRLVRPDQGRRGAAPAALGLPAPRAARRPLAGGRRTAPRVLSSLSGIALDEQPRPAT